MSKMFERALKFNQPLAAPPLEHEGKRLGLTHADVGKSVSIVGDDVKIDGERRTVHWGDAKRQDSAGRIRSVEEKPKGRVQLEDGQEFENPEQEAFSNAGTLPHTAAA